MAKINYPDGVINDKTRYAYLYRLQELLRLQHNRKGKEFRANKITLPEWQKYKLEKFDPSSEIISQEILKYRKKLQHKRAIKAKINDIVI